MLTIEPPIYTLRGATILRDHADADVHYRLPGPPRLVVDEEGAPGLTLYKYQRDLTDNPELDPTRARGGGLALFEVEVPTDDSALFEAELASLTGRPDARLAPVVFRAGEVRAIVAHAEGAAFVEDLVDERRAPLVPPHRAAFALALTAESAALFEQAARGGRLPVGVAYDLRFLALTPAVQARARMDYERIYDRFAASAGFTYYVSAKLDVDLAWLVEHDAIQIEIIAFTDEQDRARQEALVMELLKARIQNDFFRSGIPPAQPSGPTGPLADLLGGLLGGGEVTSASALFVLKARVEAVRERKDFELTFDSRSAIELTHVATSLLSTLVAGDDPDAPPPEPDVREIDTDDDFFSSLEVRISSGIDFDQMPDLREAHLHVAHGPHRQSFSFHRDGSGATAPAVFRKALTDPNDDEYEASAEYHFDPTVGGGPARIDAGPFRSRQRVLVLDPLAHLRYRRLRLLLGPVDPALVPRIRVRLRVPGDDGAGDLTQATVVLGPDAPEALWPQRLPAGGPPIRFRVRPDWEDPDGAVHEADEVDAPGDTFVALGPYRGVLSIAVQPAVDWERVTQLLVELRYVDGDHRVESLLTFDPEHPGSRTVDVPLLDRARRRYHWRQVVFRADGTTSETDWEEVDRAVLITGREAAPGRVRVVWVGPPGDALGLRVDFWVETGNGDEVPSGLFLRTGEAEGTVTLPLDPDGRLRYRYQLSRFTPAGPQPLRSGTQEGDLLVVQAT